MELQSGINSNIAVILVRPQMGENIGAIARAMMNFSISELRIVAPRDGWPNEKAISMSAGANKIIENAKVCEDLPSALVGINEVYATTARNRYMNKEALWSYDAAKAIANSNQKIGILFGPESTGLTNEDISFANYLINIETNPEFSSLNIAQAGIVIFYEIFKNRFNYSKVEQVREYADGQDIEGLFNHLEIELERKGFFKVQEKKEGMVINIRNIFKRVQNMTKQDIRTLRGVIKAIAK